MQRWIWLFSISILTLQSCLSQKESHEEYSLPDFLTAKYQRNTWKLILPDLGKISASEPNEIYENAPVIAAGSENMKIWCAFKTEVKSRNRWFFTASGMSQEKVVFYKDFPLNNCREIHIEVPKMVSFERIDFKVSWAEGKQRYKIYHGAIDKQTSLVLQGISLDKKPAGKMMQNECENENFFYSSQCHLWTQLKIKRTQLCFSKNFDVSKKKWTLSQGKCSDSSAQFQFRKRQQKGYTLQDRGTYECVTEDKGDWVLKPCYFVQTQLDLNLARQQLFLIDLVGKSIQLEILGNRNKCLGLPSGVTQSGAYLQTVSCAKDLGQLFDFI